MKILNKLFEPRQGDKQPERTVPAFIPALVQVLRIADKQKDSPWDKDEVHSIRDGAICVMMSSSRAAEMEERRGYPDINAESV